MKQRLHYEGFLDVIGDIEDFELKECKSHMSKGFSLIERIKRYIRTVGFEMQESDKYIEACEDKLGGEYLYIPNCTVKIYSSNSKISLEEVKAKSIIQTLGGTMDMFQEYYGYSEYTILGLDLKNFTIGNHDLKNILEGLYDKYIHFELEFDDKKPMPKKGKVFVHTDLDGLGCAIMATLALPQGVDITYCKYEDINEEVTKYLDNEEYKNYDFCLIADISVQMCLAHRINQANNKSQHFFLIDHHKTAKELNCFNWCMVSTHDIDNPKFLISATELLHKCLTRYSSFDNLDTTYINNETALKFNMLVDFYDTWRWKECGLDIAKDLNDLLHIRGREDFLNIMVSRIKANTTLFSWKDKELLENEAEIRNKYIDIASKNIYYIKDNQGRLIGVSYGDKYVNELCEKIYTSDPTVSYVINIGRKVVNFRTNKDGIDLSEIAKEFGGGGHMKASGCPVSDKILEFVKKEK